MRSRRLLTWIPLTLLVIAAAAVCVGWVVAARLVGGAIDRWVAERRADGYRIDYAAPVVSGFPFRLRFALDRPTIEAPGHAWQWDGPALVGEASLWRPLTIRVRLPGRHAVRWGEGDAARLYAGQAASAQAIIRLSRNGDLDTLRVELGAVKVSDDSGAEIAVQAIHLAGELPHEPIPADPPRTLDFGFEADAITLAPQEVQPLGRTIDRLFLEGTLKGPLPPGGAKAAATVWRAAGGVVDLHRLQGKWGPLAIEGDGTLALDRDLQPEGAFGLKVSGFDATLDALAAAGLIEGKRIGFARTMLGALANRSTRSGEPAIEVPLTIQDRSVLIGPVKLLQLRKIEW
ncbi:MAG: DUF2125 domain-containing protein [Dongiaceae bacterium]